MNTNFITARLRRSLARKRVRELTPQHPILEWLLGRFIVTEGLLREVALADGMHEEQRARVLNDNGFDADAKGAAIVHEAETAAISLVGLAPMADEKPKVLLVDDDPLLLRATRRAIQQHCHVLLSPSPKHALLVLQTEPVDVVVTDYDIPNTEGGVWLLEQVKARFPEVVRILISNRSVAQDIATSPAVQRFLHKNVGIEGLVRSIADCLR